VHLTAPFVTATTSIILSSTEIQNEDILVLGLSSKMAIKLVSCHHSSICLSYFNPSSTFRSMFTISILDVISACTLSPCYCPPCLPLDYAIADYHIAILPRCLRRPLSYVLGNPAVSLILPIHKPVSSLLPQYLCCCYWLWCAVVNEGNKKAQPSPTYHLHCPRTCAAAIGCGVK